MTKVSWKRILQRAGSDLPNHGHSFSHIQRVQKLSRGPRAATETPSRVAGELETELRRALRRTQAGMNAVPEQQAWDPIYVARELRHTPPAIPVTIYPVPQAKRRNTTRNILAVSLSAAIVGFAAQHMTMSWLNSGGGGGGGGDGGEPQQSQSASAAVPFRAPEPQKVVATGYAIQPLVHPGNPTDIAPAPSKETPSLFNEDKAVGKSDPAPADVAAASFKRDMEEAVKLFEEKQPQVATRQAKATPAPAPAEDVPTTAAAPAKVSSLSAAPTPVAVPSGVAGQEEDQLLLRAGNMMKRGDITGARLLYEHLANRGSALGAFALAQSYDARYLKKMYVRGMTGDQKMADFWYRRAAELGGVR